MQISNVIYASNNQKNQICYQSKEKNVDNNQFKLQQNLPHQQSFSAKIDKVSAFTGGFMGVGMLAALFTMPILFSGASLIMGDIAKLVNNQRTEEKVEETPFDAKKDILEIKRRILADQRNLSVDDIDNFCPKVNSPSFDENKLIKNISDDPINNKLSKKISECQSAKPALELLEEKYKKFPELRKW